MALVEHTLFGKVDKVQQAIERIRQHEPPDGYWVGFSGGKDSIVVKDLVRRSGVKAEYHYNLTTVDPPELVHYIHEHHPDVIVDKPRYSMWQLIEKNGLPPTRLQRYCCRELKERGGKGRLVITGIRWEESFSRSQRGIYEQGTKDKTKRYLHPVIDWNEADIWTYIEDNNLPYCSLYDEGQSRIGCIMCPLANKQQQQQEEARWPKYADMYRFACNKAYNACVVKGKKPKFCNSGDEMYEWWMGRFSAIRCDSAQMSMMS